MNWEPSRADHSIDRATASATLREPLDANALDDLIVAGRRIAEAHRMLGRLDQLEPIEVKPGVGQVVQIGLGSGPPEGVSRQVLFRRVDSEGVAVDEISLAKGRVAAGTIRYSRWVDLFKLAEDLFRGLNESIPILQNLKTVRLEFVDRFNSIPGGADHFEVISKKSPYLPPILADRDANLHAHSGWFDAESAAVRRLTNVNIDVRNIPNQTEGRRTISTLTMGQFEALEGTLDRPLERIMGLHGYLKAIFGDLITKEAAERVALNK